MNAVQVVWLAVGVTTAVGLVVIVLGLLKQVKRVGRAVVELRGEVAPTLAQLRSESERAQRRTDELARKGASFRRQPARR